MSYVVFHGLSSYGRKSLQADFDIQEYISSGSSLSPSYVQDLAKLQPFPVTIKLFVSYCSPQSINIRLVNSMETVLI